MPITCGACGIVYSPSAPKCPICGKYDTPIVYLRTWAETEAERQLTDSISADEVFRMLVAKSFSEQDAERKIQAIQSRVRKKIRAEGRRRCLLAAGVLLLGLFVISAALFSARIHSVFLLGAGGAIALSSPTALVNGIWAMLSGRDDLFVADELPGTKHKELTG